MPSPVRIALVGLGRMGMVHATALVVEPSIAVVALADPVERCRRAGAALYPGAALFSDPLEAFEHPDVEACLIAAPTPLHPDLVRAALGAGVHVLCEKPLAFDPDEAVRLGEMAVASDCVLHVGHWRRFAPPWASAKHALRSGSIGVPTFLRLCQWDATAPPPSFCDPAVSGGLAVDCGVHEFDLAEWLTGQRITRVHAWTGPTAHPEVIAVGDVDNLMVVAELDGGAKAVIDLARHCRYGDDVRSDILGTEGAILVEQLPAGRTRLGTATGMVVIPGSVVDDVTSAGVVAQAQVFAAAVRNPLAVHADAAGAVASARATAVGLAAAVAQRVGHPVEVTFGH